MSEGSLQLFTEEIEFNYSAPGQLQSWITNAIKAEGKEFSYVNIIFCSDDYLLKVNQQYLDHDYFTDIITFQYETAPLEGELFISIDRVRDNALGLSIPFEEELQRVIIHGVLHLMGYGDKTERQIEIMRSKEEEYLRTWDML